MYDHHIPHYSLSLIFALERSRHRIPLLSLLCKARSLKLKVKLRMEVQHHRLTSNLLILATGEPLD